MTPLAELPVLDPVRCTGCGDCVAVCPTDCLEMVGLVPWLPRPLDCVACAVCLLLCPAEAIRWEIRDEQAGNDEPGDSG